MKELIQILIVFSIFTSCFTKEKERGDKKGELKKVYHKYMQDIESFKSLKLNLSNIKSLDSLNYYVDFAEEKFINHPNVNIRKEFEQIYSTAYFSYSASQDNFKGSHIRCINELRTNNKIRKMCLYHLTRNLIRNDSLPLVYQLYNNLDVELKDALTEEETDAFSIIGKYLESQKEIKSKEMEQDEFEYYQAQKIIPICESSWFRPEACFDYRLLDKRLYQFLRKYPDSKFADEAELTILEHQVCGEGGLEKDDIRLLIRNYRTILKKYPDTNLKEALNYNIINTLALDQDSIENLKSLIEIFLLDYPGSEYTNELIHLKKK